MNDLFEKISLAKKLNNIDVKFGDNLVWDFLEKRIDDSNILVLMTSSIEIYFFSTLYPFSFSSSAII